MVVAATQNRERLMLYAAWVSVAGCLRVRMSLWCLNDLALNPVGPVVVRGFATHTKRALAAVLEGGTLVGWSRPFVEDARGNTSRTAGTGTALTPIAADIARATTFEALTIASSSSSSASVFPSAAFPSCRRG